jgi:hypothetical protein
LYNPISHSLAAVDGIGPEDVNVFCDHVTNVVPISQGTIVWFGAQFHKTLAKYDGGESLVWRDAGALLATFCMVSEALDLNCCGIGITGEPFLSRMLGSPEGVRGVGGCVIGTRVN